MKALIIAAGNGERINHITDGKPKPLLDVLGLTLIERAILSAKKAGINEFVIVLGYKGRAIKKYLGSGEKHNVKIEYIYNREWKKENGVSILKAEKTVGETFVLLMSDHIFDYRILQNLIKKSRSKCILCVDRSPDAYIDMEDATKVRTDGKKIIDIGKDIKKYDAVDCGIFLLNKEIFKAIKESVKRGETSLSAAVKILAKNNKIEVFDIKNLFWLDVDTKKDYVQAKKLLLKNLIKQTDGPVSRHINRKVSTALTKLFLKTNTSPDTISLISLFLSVISCHFFVLGNYFSVILGGIMAQLSSIIDGCDGEVARLKFKETKSGAFFDAVLDRYADTLIIFGMVYGFWTLTGNLLVWIAGFFALSGTLINSYTSDKYKAEFCKPFVSRKMPVGRDARCFIIMIGAFLNQVFYTIVLLSIFTHIENLRRAGFVKLKNLNPGGIKKKI